MESFYILTLLCKAINEVGEDRVPTLTERLANTMKLSGYEVKSSDPRLAPVIAKLEFLEDSGRFGRLLSNLLACNDKSNLHALLFEAVFAWHFERKGRHLKYEVTQQESGRTTIDFLQVLSTDMRVYYELRLLQQKEAITQLFEEQLRQSDYFGTALNGSDVQREVIRLQHIMLDKIQDRKGQPVKFFTADSPNYNLIVVDVSEFLLGGIDKYDCILACYGDEEVPPSCRCDVFGVFQVPTSDSHTRFQDIVSKFDRFRKTIHGVVFMRRVPEFNSINFELLCYCVPNRSILSKKPYECILSEAAKVFTEWKVMQENA